MSPKTLGAFTDVTRQLMIQSSLDVENLIRNDLAGSMAIAIDNAALEGSGSSGNPTGITNTTGINTVGFTTTNKIGIHKFKLLNEQQSLKDIRVIDGGHGLRSMPTIGSVIKEYLK